LINFSIFQNKATGQWFELQDLHVTETMPQLIGKYNLYKHSLKKKFFKDNYT
jgi:hypothetical protein